MDHNNNAKYAFYYLLSLASLIFVGLSIGMVAFGIIDRSVSDALDSSYYNYNGQLKFAISALLIASPIYYWMSSLISKGLKKGELDKDSGIRRWLTYFIILVSSLIILGFLIGIINSFLSGELTTRFILKSLSVFIISGSVFSYYLYDIKREEVVSRKPVTRIFLFASLAIVLAAFISAWFFVESPKEARNRRLDDMVVSNMRSIEGAVNSYFEQNDRLPADLSELESGSRINLSDSVLVDPETKTPIEYKTVDDISFELCATFRTDSNANQRQAISYDYSHEAGYQCITDTVWNKAGLKDDTVMAEPVL